MKGRLSIRKASREMAGSEGWIKSSRMYGTFLGMKIRRFTQISNARTHWRNFSKLPFGLCVDGLFIPASLAFLKEGLDYGRPLMSAVFYGDIVATLGDDC